jgi:sulfonate transport system permease protein
VLLILAWHLSTHVFKFFSENQLPAPLQVYEAVRELIANGGLEKHFQASLFRVGLGFSLGAILAILIGMFVGLSRTVERFLDPTLQAVRNVPSLAWVPFLLLWLGIDEIPKITLIAIGSFFPVYINVVAGIRQVDRKLLEVGYIFGLGHTRLVRQICLPAALPFIVTGIRIGAGQAWLFLTAAELIASTRGFGFMLVDGQNSMRPDIMLVSIFSLALLGKGTDSLLRLFERRLLHWSDTFKGGN